MFELLWLTGKSRGIIVIHNLKYNIRLVFVSRFASFKYLVLSVSSPNTTIIPQFTGLQGQIKFLCQSLSMLYSKFKRILILGDFNIHIDQKNRDFLSLLECFSLSQAVNGPTHNKGHTLDLVITNGSSVSQTLSIDVRLSDGVAFF